MNMNETIKILTMLLSEFNGGRTLNDDEFSMKAKTWQSMFADESYQIMQESLVKLFKTRKSHFTPTVAEMMEVVQALKNPQIAEINPDDSFTKVRNKILSISSWDLYREGEEVKTCDMRLREVLTELEYEAMSMIGGHNRFRMAVDSEMSYMRNDYKKVMQTLQQRALAGEFTTKYGIHPSLMDVHTAALKADNEQGIDTSIFRNKISGFIKKEHGFVTEEKLLQYKQESERQGLERQ